MGFGSYDETEQANQSVDTDFDEADAVDAEASDHQGSVEFEFEESGDALIDRLAEMRDE